MLVFDTLFYISWIYLSTLIISEILIYDFSFVFQANLNSSSVKMNNSINYYLNRKNIFLYKITPLFCLLQVITIIANIVFQYADYWVSAISILVLAVLLIIIQTKKNIVVVIALKGHEKATFSDNVNKLKSIYHAHVITFLILLAMLYCYIFKF